MNQQINPKVVEKVKALLGISEDHMLILIAETPDRNGVSGCITGDNQKLLRALGVATKTIQRETIMAQMNDLMHKLVNL